MTPNILIVEARFYDHIADLLLDGATAALEAGGAQPAERITVPGALEFAGHCVCQGRRGRGQDL